MALARRDWRRPLLAQPKRQNHRERGCVSVSRAFTMTRLMVSFKLQMKGTLRLFSVCSIAFLSSSLAPSAAGKVDAVFKAFWEARTPQGAARLFRPRRQRRRFRQALKRLKAGRPYSAKVRRVVTASIRADGREFFYALNIPACDQPAPYQARITCAAASAGDNGFEVTGQSALAGAERIYIIPCGWNVRRGGPTIRSRTSARF